MDPGAKFKAYGSYAPTLDAQLERSDHPSAETYRGWEQWINLEDQICFATIRLIIRAGIGCVEITKSE